MGCIPMESGAAYWSFSQSMTDGFLFRSGHFEDETMLTKGSSQLSLKF